MHVGKKLAVIVMGSMLAASGCVDGGNVTGTQIDAPDAPMYNGIGWAGSGNRSDSTATYSGDGGGWVGSGNRTVTDSVTTDAAGGSGWAGSGN